jgi:hypothetical protein
MTLLFTALLAWLSEADNRDFGVKEGDLGSLHDEYHNHAMVSRCSVGNESSVPFSERWT